MDNLNKLNKFILHNEELFESDVLENILTKEQYFIITTYYLALKNNLCYSEDIKENTKFILLVISKLASKYKVLDKEYRNGFILRCLFFITSTIKSHSKEKNFLDLKDNIEKEFIGKQINNDEYIQIDKINKELLDIQNRLNERRIRK